MRGFSLLLVATIASAVAACAGQNTDADSGTSDVTTATVPTVQMNDMSIVLPMAKTQAEVDQGYLLPSDSGNGGALIPEALYVKYSGFPAKPSSVGVGADAGQPYSQLRAVAFRIDPCFANIGPVTNDAGCDNQLRIVFQAITFSRGTASANDGAIHAFYKLTRAELVDLLNDVVAARIANGGTGDLGPLAPHPLVVKQGLLGAENKALKAAVLKHAGTKTFSRFTEFASGGTGFFWNFSGFDVSGSKATPMVIPTLPDSATREAFSLAIGDGKTVAFTPESTATDNMQLLANSSSAKAATPAAQQSALDAAFKLENPAFESPNTASCASCHTTAIAKDNATDLHLSVTTNPNAFVADSTLVSAADMKATTQFDPNKGTNLHMFSYRGDDLMIGQRVINETASVVAYVNGTLAK